MAESENRQPDKVPAEARPFAAPCNDLNPSDTLRWLRAGLQDYRSALGLSLGWGGFCFLLSWLVVWLAWNMGGLAWLIGLVSGFVFVGPLLAFAMYAISRKICMGIQPTLINTLVGTQGKYTTDEVSSFLKDLIVARLTDMLGTMNLSMLDLPAKFDEIAAGKVSLEDSPLHNSPHTADDVVGDDWPHAYSREQAAYPVPGLRDDKYWSPVGRIDSAYGDRKLVCACPPMEVYRDGIPG